MKWSNLKISVTLIDDASNTELSCVSMEPDDLPDTFALDTTLHIREEEWTVVDAKPQTKAEFSKTGVLIIRLRKVEIREINPKELMFSQLDITGGFDDDVGLDPTDWVETKPLNTIVEDPESSRLPPPDADAEEVYRIASKLSEVRESLHIPRDGVYCPVCHIANIDLTKLRAPCPQCGRELLKFGWT